jgi:hypothetical protein
MQSDGVSRRSELEQAQAPQGRKRSYDTDSVRDGTVLTQCGQGLSPRNSRTKLVNIRASTPTRHPIPRPLSSFPAALAQPKQPLHPTLTTLIPASSRHVVLGVPFPPFHGAIPSRDLKRPQRPHPTIELRTPNPLQNQIMAFEDTGSGTAHVERTLLSAAFDFDSDSAYGSRVLPAMREPSPRDCDEN